MPTGGGSEETASTGVEREPSERSAALRSRRVLHRQLAEVGLGDDEHVGDLHDPGLQELQHVAAAGLHDDGDGVGDVGDSVSAWPTPTVSITTTSNAAASACAAARVGRREAAEALAGGGRADQDAASAASNSIRARSPSRAPPERRELGSTASIATVARAPRQACSSAESSVDLPAPGGPVIPITCPGASPPSARGRDLAQQRARPARGRSAVELSSRLSAAGRRAQVALAQARAERGPVGAHATDDAARAAAVGGDGVAGAGRCRARCAAPAAPPTNSTMSRMICVISKSFGRVDAATPASLQRRDVLLGDDPADDHRRGHAGLAQRVDHRGDQLAVRAGEDRQPDHVHALLQRRGGDLGGGQADPFVDDVHARVARAHGDLLGAVGVAVEAGLADEDLRPAAEPLLQA